jgi:hypothetical protein
MQALGVDLMDFPDLEEAAQISRVRCDALLSCVAGWLAGKQAVQAVQGAGGRAEPLIVGPCGDSALHNVLFPATLLALRFNWCRSGRRTGGALRARCIAWRC